MFRERSKKGYIFCNKYEGNRSFTKERQRGVAWETTEDVIATWIANDIAPLDPLAFFFFHPIIR
jgi:hypothetical protein